MVDDADLDYDGDYRPAEYDNDPASSDSDDVGSEEQPAGDAYAATRGGYEDYDPEDAEYEYVDDELEAYELEFLDEWEAALIAECEEEQFNASEEYAEECAYICQAQTCAFVALRSKGKSGVKGKNKPKTKNGKLPVKENAFFRRQKKTSEGT